MDKVDGKAARYTFTALPAETSYPTLPLIGLSSGAILGRRGVALPSEGPNRHPRAEANMAGVPAAANQYRQRPWAVTQLAAGLVVGTDRTVHPSDRPKISSNCSERPLLGLTPGDASLDLRDLFGLVRLGGNGVKVTWFWLAG